MKKIYDILISDFREPTDDDISKGLACEAAVGYIIEQTKLLHYYAVLIGQRKLSVNDAPKLEDIIK